ncbi:MAG TPA: hypothetical protein DD490_03805, partial [Acidobacteria bacterium]|nr:hypothetical protein [Acidobacteriota bacterium]
MKTLPVYCEAALRRKPSRFQEVFFMARTRLSLRTAGRPATDVLGSVPFTMRLQRAEGATALLLTLFAVALHLRRLVSAGPLWRDEAAAFHLATAPTLGEVIARHESFPPPFFFLLRIWASAFGGSDAALRTFGLVAGLALLAALWGGLRQAGGTMPLLGLALVAIHPTVVLYGDSLRGYGLGTAALLAACGAFARLAARPDRRSVLVAGAAAVVSVQLLFLNVPLLGAIGLAACGAGIVRRRPAVLLAVAGIGAVAALSLVPWAGSVLATRTWSVLLHVPLGPREIFLAMAQTAGSSIPTLGWIWLLAIVAGPPPPPPPPPRPP